jgi:hypothetical protein
MVFADSATREDYSERKMNFIRKNVKDENMVFREGLSIPGFKQAVLATTSEDAVPGWLNSRTYWMTALFCL